MDSPKPPLVPQENGRGALYAGGVKGNAGGGRPPSHVRAAHLSNADKGASFIARFLELATLKLEEASTVQDLEELRGYLSEVIRSIDVSNKYGLGEQKVVMPEELVSSLSEALLSERGKVLDEEVLERIVKNTLGGLG
jgi:predicted RNA-binding protein Jag